MSFYFLDTSALIKYYVDEVGSPWVETTDKGLLAAAEAVTMQVENPNLHP
jgi:predicted nucleic acid-binding protein